MTNVLASIDGEMIPIVAIAGGLLIGLVAVVGSMFKGAHDRKQIEESRREIAAYVAEGSMTPEDAERLLAAKPKGGNCDWS